MKLSEKYFAKYKDQFGTDTNHVLKYGEICSIETEKAVLVQFQDRINHDQYMAGLERTTNQLQAIAEQEKL